MISKIAGSYDAYTKNVQHNSRVEAKKREEKKAQEVQTDNNIDKQPQSSDFHADYQQSPKDVYLAEYYRTLGQRLSVMNRIKQADE